MSVKLRYASLAVENLNSDGPVGSPNEMKDATMDQHRTNIAFCRRLQQVTDYTPLPDGSGQVVGQFMTNQLGRILLRYRYQITTPSKTTTIKTSLNS